MTSTRSPQAGMYSGDIRRAVEQTDFVVVNGLLTDDERAVRDRVRAWVDDRVIPIMPDYWDRADFPFELLPELGGLGIMGGALHGYDCSGWSNVGYGLAVQEIARGSGSLATFLHVQSGLVMTVIHELGSEKHREDWLPDLSRCKKIGCFGLTEPDTGSDAGSITTTAVRIGDEYVLNGRKRWIGNASIADIAAIVARDQDGNISVFLVDDDTPGYRAEVLPRKGAQRAVWQAEITLENCRIPEANRLPGGQSLKAILGCLTHSRYGVAWDGLGQAMDCFEMARAYTREREQFGRPIASYQLVQQKLVNMITELSLAQVLSIHIGRLKERGEATPGMISMLKMNNVSKARQIASLAREALGGNGILLDFRVMEHMADLEGTFTYEGTHDINMLIVGQALTGMKAFSAPSDPPPDVPINETG